MSASPGNAAPASASVGNAPPGAASGAGAPRLLGAVLAGGASRRFGSPKWRAPVGGEPMGQRAVAALAPCVAAVVAISPDREVGVLGVEVRPDLEAGQGPLGGIRTALAWAAERSLDGALVLACDLPLVGSSLLAWLVAAWDGEELVAPLGPSGPEPLCALYGAAVLPRVEAALRHGERSPRRLLEAPGVRLLPLHEAQAVAGLEHPFLNVNTPGRRARAEAALAALAATHPPASRPRG